MTNTDTTPKPRATPIPQGYDRILAGALKLPFAERAMIAQKLTEANKQEVAELQEKLKAMNGQTPGA